MKRIVIVVLAIVMVAVLTGCGKQNAVVHTGTVCKSCLGTGICGHCEGSGECGLCDGAGKTSNYYSSFGMVTHECSLCKGTGNCLSCKGSGSCRYCDGTGYKD